MSRTPQGVRGLKQYIEELKRKKLPSHSARSAWIETVEAKGNKRDK